MGYQVVQMPDHRFPAYVGHLPPIGGQETGGKVQADHAFGFGDYFQLPIRQVAAARRHCMCIGMGGDQWLGADLCHIIEALFVQMRQVDHDAQLVAFLDEGLARRGQPRPGVGAAGVAKRHAVAKHGRTAPHRANAAQAHGVKGVQGVKVGVDGFGTFHVHDAEDDVLGHAGFDLGDGGADLESMRGEPLDRQQMPGFGQCNRLGGGVVDQVGQGQGIGRVIKHRLKIRLIGQVGGRDINRKEPTREVPLCHTRQVKVALAVALQPDGVAVLRVVEEAEQKVVMAVDEGEGHGGALGVWVARVKSTRHLVEIHCNLWVLRW